MIGKLVDAIGGLELPDLPARVDIPDLPRVIHVARVDSPLRFPSSMLGPVVAAKYSHVGGLRVPGANPEMLAAWRAERGILAGQRLFLYEESIDDTLERLSPWTFGDDFWERLHGLGADVLASPGYSVYDEGVEPCEWLQLMNMKRAFDFASRAAEAGLPCIPTIGWNRRRPMDIWRLADWLVRQGDKVNHLAVNAQTGGAGTNLALAEGLERLFRLAERSCRVVVFGGPSALTILEEALPSVQAHLVTSAATQATAAGIRYGTRTRANIPFQELLEENMARVEGASVCSSSLRSRASLV